MLPLSLDEIRFAAPWAFAVVALVSLSPLLAGAAKSWLRRSSAESLFVSPEMREQLYEADTGRALFSGTVTFLFWLCALSLSIALTRPQWGVMEQTVERRGLDIIIAIDLSSSMRAEDVKPSRIDNAREELAFLVEELKGNRIGLVGFAGSAFLFCPLTLDTDAIELFLDEMTIEAVPVPGTSLGGAIRTALRTFEMGGPSEGGSRILLLLTDGEDHESQPVEAAKEAASAGVIIDTVGLGTMDGSEIPDPISGDKVLDESGKVVISKLDGKILEEVSRVSGGSFMRLDASRDGLTSYLKILKGRQTRSLGESVDVRRHERYPLFAGLAAAAFLLALILQEWDKRR